MGPPVKWNTFNPVRMLPSLARAAAAVVWKRSSVRAAMSLVATSISW
jgi:hypothetical protein